MTRWLAGLPLGLLGLTCLGSGPWMLYREFSSTNQEDPSAAGALLLGALAIFTGLVLLVTAVSIWRRRPILGLRLPEPEDLI